ncbi:flagellar hook capping FlgD N-terminal domain-containing protein [Planctomonas deserti]|uniref:flagellar hook capping FlgD N-terminal domain-containing protein n=1 Tax=Planctomonas deserti TaxID=2144185 RepID=UPI000D39C12A|nr:flagellar hook capping FlgD N-terminal domain-containing protein [Planctomonas deserti]
MPIDAISATTSPTTTPTRAPKQTMDGEVFMSLLVSQLRNQDPSSPMDTNEMIAQTTQLAMMEKITAMTTTSEENFSLQMRMASASLIGKQVSYAGPDGATVTGTATSVSYAGAVPQVTVDGKAVSLDVIAGITAAASGSPASPTSPASPAASGSPASPASSSSL